MRKTQFVAAIAACMLAFAGCGDDTTDTNVDDSNAGGATAGGATQGDTTAGEDAGGAQGGDTQGQTTGGTDAGSTTAGTDAGMTTGGTPDSGMMSLADDPKTPGHDGAGKVACGSETTLCSATQKCCAGFMVASCKNSCSTITLEQVAACDGPEDCPKGQSCCSKPSSPTQCAASCASDEQAACHTDADCVGEKNICTRSTFFSWWGFCS